MRRLGIVAAALAFFATATMAQGIQGLGPGTRPVEVAVSFNFLSFHEVPGTIVNNPGVTASAMYRYDRVGLEGEVSDSIGSQNGSSSQLVFAGGGLRYFLPEFGTVRPWTEAEVGLAHISPSPSYGMGRALGYKVGAGFNFNPIHSRLEYRISADVLGSTFFNTYQVSPEVSFGIVLPLGRNE
jgi:hypothetical protein